MKKDSGRSTGLLRVIIHVKHSLCLMLALVTAWAQGEELAMTKEDTARPVANRIIPSPDGSGRIELLPAENLRKAEAVFEPHPVLLFTSGKLTPFVMYASDMGNLANLGAWTGSSRFAFVLTGLHHDQELAVIYPEKSALRGKPLDLMPIWAHGDKKLPWTSGGLAHNSILEIVPGKGDSVTCLYWRTADKKGLATVVTITIQDPAKPTEVTFTFGESTLTTFSNGETIPTLSQLMKQEQPKAE